MSQRGVTGRRSTKDRPTREADNEDDTEGGGGGGGGGGRDKKTPRVQSV
jgi:hypothetical protein